MSLSNSRIIKLKCPVSKVFVVPAQSQNDHADGNVQQVTFDNSAATSTGKEQELIQISREDFQKEVDYSYKKGLEDGKIQGVQHAQAEFSQTMKVLSEMVNTFNQQQLDLVKNSEECLLEVVFKMVEKVIGTLADQQKELIKETLSKVLRESESAAKIKIIINPQDLQAVQELEPQLRQHLPDLQELGIVSDESVTCGGCIVETNLGKLDGRIEPQLNELTRQLKKIYQDL